MGIELTYTSNGKKAYASVGDSGSSAFTSGNSYSELCTLIQSTGLIINNSEIPIRFQKDKNSYPRVMYTIGSCQIKAMSSGGVRMLDLDKPLSVDMWNRNNNTYGTEIELISSVSDKSINLYARAADMSLGQVKEISNIFLGFEAAVDPASLT